MSSKPDGKEGASSSDPQPVGAPSAEQVGNIEADTDATATVQPVDEGSKRHAFGWTYWMLNSVEMFERLAYFGIRAVVPIYIMQATEPGGLHLTALHKGWIYAWWAILQSWLPMFTGGIADRYGYKRVLAYAICANVVGYLMMAYMHDYYGFFAGILVLATGTAFFKPALQGSIAQNLTKETSSLGWGVFYWVVNVGAAAAPIFATVILGRPHSAEGWQNLFLASAGYTACNLLLLLTFKDVPSGADKSRSLVRVFATTVENIWYFWFRGGSFHPVRGPLGIAVAVMGLGIVVLQVAPWYVGVLLLLGGTHLASWLQGGRFTWQLRLPAFLLIMSCFWMMMYQLWDLHPNFIEDWIDSGSVADYVPLDSWREYGDRGLIRVPQQILLTFYNAFLIILLVVPISWLVRKMRTLSAMLIGMMMAAAGVLIAGLSGNGWILLAGITCFSFGEMLTGPKKNQYLGLIAPPGKKGLYLGYVNIPIGVGVGLGSIIAGVVYDNYGEKAGLALKELGTNTELVARAARSIDWSDSLDQAAELAEVERSEAFTVACTHLKQDADRAAATLRGMFGHDRGQIVNLGRQYLARTERHGDEADRVNAMEVLGLVRDEVNRGVPTDQRKEDAEIVEMLWGEFGNSPATLNNLALEYLAQGTSVIGDAVAGMTFEKPTEELPKRVGIGRTKSFAALSAARGASDAEVEQALAGLDMPAADAADRSYAYLASLPHQRFLAVAVKDWTLDVTFLRELIEGDDSARATAREKLNGELDYAKLAEEQDWVQAALAVKDWTKAPKEAAQLLGLNPFEARALVAAEVNNSAQSTTRLLWERYDPQYKVWIPFAAIGILAAIALGIFGQMAKRWADMNA
ncbi:MAG TPA: MFS transporter [Phycisphaerae bacterium]|nr:MFS transporter [Phycisphaerae bacterium]